jgi:phospholipid transport system transporter-binding protein
VLRLPAQLTQSQARACLDGLLAQVANETSGPVVIDASALLHFDSSALSVLLACRRASRGLGRPFAVQGLPARLQSLAALYGIEALLPAA